MKLACWCAACARGGTGVSNPARGVAAQSPIANTSGSSVVCSVGFTTSWLLRVTSSPSKWRRKSGPFTPADHTTSSDAITSPSASTTPSARTSATLAPVRTSTPRPRRRSSALADMRSGSAGRMRGAASIRMMRTSRSGFTRSSPCATTSRTVRCSSAANSVPVAPAPMMAT